MFDYYEVNDTVVVQLDYDLAENTVLAFNEDMLSLIEQGKTHFILDLKLVTFMTSMGLGTLCELSKRLRPIDGWIRLARVNHQLRDFFSFTMLTDMFQIFKTIEEATTAE